MKLLEEMPKITKCLKCLKLRYSVDFKLEIQDWELFNFPDFCFPYAQHRSFIKKTGRSDTTNRQYSIPACPDQVAPKTSDNSLTRCNVRLATFSS